MPKVTANGQTFNFPDGISQEEIGRAIDEYFAGSASLQQDVKEAAAPVISQAVGVANQAVDAAKQFGSDAMEKARAMLPEKRAVIPPPMTLPFGMTQGDIDLANYRNMERNELINRISTDPDALQKYVIAKEGGPGMALSQGAARVLTGFSEGISDIIDKQLPAGISNILNYKIGEQPTSPDERIKEREYKMTTERLAGQVSSLANPVSTGIGELIPYLATDVLLSPVTGAALNVGAKGATTLGRGILKGAEALEGGLKASKALPSQQLGEIISPLTRQMKNIAERPAMNEALVKSYKELARAPLTGAIEGGAHYDTTAGQGAFSSFLGQATAMGPVKSVLGRADVVISPTEKKTLDTMIERGYRATPGMRTGSKVLQAKEQGFRSEARFRDYMNEYDTANRKVISDYASEAMGIPKQASADLTDEVLSNHMKDLSSQYKALEAGTTGKYGAKQVQQVGNILKDLQPTQHRNTSPVDKQRYQIVKSYVDQLRSEVSSPRRGQSGKFQGYEFDGGQYQALRQRLQDEISQAYNSGDRRLGSSLKKIQGVLDDSLTQGMDKVTAKEWKDLNERYAMTRMVMENGMDPLGGIDLNRLSKHLMSGDEAVRTLTGQGGRIKKLQDIVKIDAIQRRQAGVEGWSGSGIVGDEGGKKGLLRSTISTPLITRIPMGTRGGMNLYMSGYPAVTGLTGLPKPAIAKLSRAYEQSSQGIEQLAEDAAAGSMAAYDKLLKLMGGQ